MDARAKSQRAPARTRLAHWPAVAIGLLILAACTPSRPGVTTVYYNVPGTTVEEINEQITIRGPQNGHAIGTTETRMTPKVRSVRFIGLCWIEQVDVVLELKVTLPRWLDLDKADKRTRTGFAGLATHVEEHEQRHVEISQEYAEKIEQALLAMPPEETCVELISKARVRFKDLFEEHNQAQRDFDEQEREAIERRLSALGYGAYSAASDASSPRTRAAQNLNSGILP